MVRISIPTLPPRATPIFNPLADITLPQAASRLSSFLAKGKGRTLVITGAGVSVDSGIRAYRGKEGHYTTNPNFRPVYYGELVDPSPVGESFRKRYWSRGFLGWPPVRDSQPNPIHYGIAAMMWMGLSRQLITQNVDGLHNKASPYSKQETDQRILALHGTLHLVHCKQKHTVSREDFQATLERLNPTWKMFAEEAAKTGTSPRTNPDGDVDLRGVPYESFNVPSCQDCGDIVKPNVVFFGETIAEDVKERASQAITDSSQILVLGTSLATYSAFRLIKQAKEENKPILMVSTGPSRADGDGVDKIEMEAGPVLKLALKELSVGMNDDQILQRLLTSGVIKNPDHPPDGDSKE
ncbi:Sirtuin 4 and related class II sirtuins (SIR2 family) [Phaffia rhodozyma]|uniref:Sirtuin 4 and related class II sirtuins (SIR2 family) n=1 Tax=Phaffia rhodozyma TaxID=264483 RepID=A0A0F7SIT5_PHARH|nr:Sirtuin 4 and related class II sirtuins (SIR2 family) [Phaffia rhodozyma]